MESGHSGERSSARVSEVAVREQAPRVVPVSEQGEDHLQASGCRQPPAIPGGADRRLPAYVRVELPGQLSVMLPAVSTVDPRCHRNIGEPLERRRSEERPSARAWGTRLSAGSRVHRARLSLFTS
jgi:hypothetical protein